MPVVVVVEDERILGVMLQSQLKSYGHANLSAVLFRSAAGAAKWIDSAESVDAAIVDLYLSPFQDAGFEVMEKLRVRFPNVPVIVLTIRNDTQALDRTKKFEAARYFIDKQRWTEARLHECLRSCLSGEAKGLEVIGGIEG
jgi:DNA-binding NarL/FixJ family response regulator